MNLFGHWIGNFEGTRAGAVTIGIEQYGEKLQGVATFNEPSIGHYQYMITGTAAADISLQLKPASPEHARSIGLGVISVKCGMVDTNTISGQWKSTNGHTGVFTAKRYANTPAAEDGKAARTNVFISYSHVDRPFLDALLVHLRPLERAGHVDVWADTKIKAGARWKEAVEAALNQACVAVLLISPDFLASDFIVENELPPILGRAQSKGIRILPLILRPCRFTRDTSLGQFQAINDPKEHLSKLPTWKHDEYYDVIAREIETSMPRKGYP